MKIRVLTPVLVLLPLVTTFGFAEQVTLDTTTSALTKRFDAQVELRPSWTLKEDRVHTEDSAEVWYNFDKNHEFHAIQYFNTNMFDTKGADQGLGFDLQPTWLVYKMKGVWENKRAGMTVDSEPTAILPTYAPDRRAGKVVELREAITLNKDFSESVYVRISEIPTVMAFTQAGSVTDDGPTANPIAENRFYLTGGVNLTDKLNFEFPVWLIVTKYRDYAAGAKNNGAWGTNLMIWPELDYKVDGNWTVGVSYYSDNFVASDLSGFTVRDAFNKGAAQLVLRATL